jgi:predicted alpha/beta hydrolase family esterase
MKRQIVVIQGGDAFENYEDYLNSLRTKEITLERIRSKGWKKNLQKELGENFDVLVLSMPNPQNARYLEWKIWFERIIPLLNDEVVFIGHSLGGIFLAKYLSENVYPKKIKATVLVSAPYDTPTEYSLVDFAITSPLDKFVKQAGKIVLYHSKDDDVVPFDDIERYHKEIPNAELRVFENRQHFNQESFPEIVELIKKLAVENKKSLL